MGTEENPNTGFLLSLFVVIFVLFAQGQSDNSKEPCGNGTYRHTSDQLPSGSCSDCPDDWRDCRREAGGDKAQCERACGKPSPAPAVSTIVTPPVPSSSGNVAGQKPATTGGKSSHTELWLPVIIAVLVCMLIFGVAFLTWRRRERRKSTTNDSGTPDDGSVHTSPDDGSVQDVHSSSMSIEQTSF